LTLQAKKVIICLSLRRMACAGVEHIGGFE
jgi:hypothetical protein